MTAPPAAAPARLRSLAATAFACAVALHVVVASHRPAVPPDGLAPTARLGRANSPLATVVDVLAPPPGVLPVDVHPAPLLLLACAAALAAVWLRRLALPPALAVIVGVSVTLLPHAWTRHGAGVDPVLLIAALAAAGSVEPGASRRTHAAATAVAVLHAPASLWLALPPIAARRQAQRRHVRAVALATIGTAAVLGSVMAAWPVVHAACGGGTWAGALRAAWLPALDGHGASLARLGTLLSALRTEWHPFLLLTAIVGAWTHGTGQATLRRASILTFAAAGVAAAVGAADPGVVVPWLDAFLLPWYALGCLVLWHAATGATAVVGRTALACALIGLPLLLHADRWAGALANDVPALRAAAFTYASRQPVVVDSVQAARLGRQHGAWLVAGTPAAVTTCAADGHAPLVLGEGLPGEPLAYHVPLGDLARDLTPRADVALALGADAGPWLRPRDAGAVEAFGLPADVVQRREAVAAVGTRPFASVARARPPDAAHQVADAPRWLRVEARADADGGVVAQGTPGRPLAVGRLGAVVVFDETETAVLAGLPLPDPGLPLQVHTRMPALRLARVSAGAVAAGPVGPRDLLLPRRRARAVDALSAHEVDVHEGDGWHAAEPAGDASFRWSAATPADAVFYLAGPQRLRLHVDAAPATLEGAPNALSLSLNGEVIAEGLDGPREIEVDARVTRAGVNVLTFHTLRVLPPGTVAGDPRPLAGLVRDVRVTRLP